MCDKLLTIIALYYVLYYMLCNVFTMNSDSMLNFLSIIPIISVMHFALLFLQLVFSFAYVFLQFLYLLSASIGEIHIFINIKK